VLASASSFYASLVDGEAVLRVPYDERLRQLLRALPGRRWDPVERGRVSAIMVPCSLEFFSL
jgi:hypothetical protein